MTAVLDEIARLREAAQAAAVKAAKAQALMDQKKEEIYALTKKLQDEFGCANWAEAKNKLAELAEEAEAATTKARETLVSEGIISE